MRQFFILMTTSLILAASFMARANSDISNEVVIPTQHIHFDKNSMIVKAKGRLPSPCMTNPRPALNLTEQEGVLFLDIVAQQPRMMCSAVLGGGFELAFDVRSLKHDLVELNLNPDAPYIIVTRNGALELPINFSEFSLAHKYAQQALVNATIGMTENGLLAIQTENDEIYTVNSPFIEVANYVGQRVSVQGLILKSCTPGVNLNRGSQDVLPGILVTGINTQAY